MTATLPAAWYHEPTIYEAERRSLWPSEWVVLGPATHVEAPGSYLADEVAGHPIAVVRAPDGELHGYHNVCPHRAGPLVWPGTGTTANLVCKYHGWAFRWDGSLLSARDFGDQPPLCVDDQRLQPVAVETWANLVWVRLRADDAPPLADELGTFVGAATRHPVDTFAFSHRLVRHLASNWKTYVDNYLEGYHVPILHPSLRRQLDMSTYQVKVVEDTYCVHSAEPAAGATVSGVWLFRYPNLAFNVYAEGMNIERVVPTGHQTCDVVYDYFVAPGVDAEEMFSMSNVVLDEDQAICEAVQRNLASGRYDAGVLSTRHERGLAWFQGRVAATVRAHGDGA